VRPGDSLFEDAIFTNDQFVSFLNGYKVLGNIYENDKLTKQKVDRVYLLCYN